PLEAEVAFAEHDRAGRGLGFLSESARSAERGEERDAEGDRRGGGGGGAEEERVEEGHGGFSRTKDLSGCSGSDRERERRAARGRRDALRELRCAPGLPR